MKRLSLALVAIIAIPAHAAWGTGAGNAGTCTANSKTAGTSLTCTVATENMEAGKVAILWAGMDNVQTTDGNSTDYTSVQDSASNTWTKLREFTNGQGAAAGGATVCLFYSKLATQLTSGTSTITLNHSSLTARGIVVKEFQITSGNVVSIVGTPQDLANDAADPGSMTVGSLTNSEHLFLRATALERATGGTWRATTNFTSSTCNGSNAGGAASNMDACGEFRILTGTTATSDPTGTAVDCASVFLAVDEAAPPAGPPMGTLSSLGVGR